jgi:hypothetical protein
VSYRSDLALPSHCATNRHCSFSAQYFSFASAFAGTMKTAVLVVEVHVDACSMVNSADVTLCSLCGVSRDPNDGPVDIPILVVVRSRYEEAEPPQTPFTLSSLTMLADSSCVSSRPTSLISTECTGSSRDFSSDVNKVESCQRCQSLCDFPVCRSGSCKTEVGDNRAGLPARPVTGSERYISGFRPAFLGQRTEFPTGRFSMAEIYICCCRNLP